MKWDRSSLFEISFVFLYTVSITHTHTHTHKCTHTHTHTHTRTCTHTNVHTHTHTLQAGIITLLYLLVRNMFSKQRLTPRVIKAWISLLCVVTVWTILSVYLLVCAQRVESATQAAVHQLSEEMVRCCHNTWLLSMCAIKYFEILWVR